MMSGTPSSWKGRDDLLPVGDVAGFDLEVFSGDGPEFVFVASADGDGASGFGEGLRGAEPDAASTAGDDALFFLRVVSFSQRWG